MTSTTNPLNLSDTDLAFVRAYIDGAQSFTPDLTTTPYDRDGLADVVNEIAWELDMDGDELIAAITSTATECMFCGTSTHQWVEGREGDRVGHLCSDCAFWCDGNIVEG